MDNISFDIKRKVGIIFSLLDNLQSSTIGIFSLANSREEAIRFMNNGF